MKSHTWDVMTNLPYQFIHAVGSRYPLVPAQEAKGGDGWQTPFLFLILGKL